MQNLPQANKTQMELVPIQRRAFQRKKWLEIVQDFKKSKQSRRRYCEENQINHHTMRYWLDKLKDQREPGFIPVKYAEENKQEVAVQTESQSYRRLCSIEFGGDKRLVIESSEALKELKNLLKVLQ